MMGVCPIALRNIIMILMDLATYFMEMCECDVWSFGTNEVHRVNFELRWIPFRKYSVNLDTILDPLNHFHVSSHLKQS